jgi:uncharacterized protein YbaR (Trm112 family)
MTAKTRILHTARLKNNCPTCFGNDGLEFTFTQEETETPLFKNHVNQIDKKLYCHTCKTEIYPINWTEDIERVYDYNKKIAETNKQYLKVKPLFYILVLLAIVVFAAIVYILIPT